MPGLGYTIRINGQAFTEYACQICGTAGMHGNKGTEGYITLRRGERAVRPLHGSATT